MLREEPSDSLSLGI